MTVRIRPSSFTPFPEPLVRFVELFNHEEFWESHEVLEHPWRETRSSFYQGLILYASAFVHVQRGNPRGVIAQLQKTQRALQQFAPDYLGVDVATLLKDADQLLQRMEALGDEPEQLLRAVQFPRICLDPERVLGSEMEATTA